MSLTTGEMSAADLAAVVGNRNDGLGGFGGEGWWIILYDAAIKELRDL